MKALSLTQPWAEAIKRNLKQWETRSWPTHLRGEVCIHASKGFPKWARDFAYENGFTDLVVGAIVCVCDLTECRQTDTLRYELSPEELKFGDYSPGRYAFKLENVRVLTEPVPAVGKLGFWNVPWEPAVQVHRIAKAAGQMITGVPWFTGVTSRGK